MRDAMQPGDGVLFYHSSCPQPGIAGLARIAGRAAARCNPVRRRQPLLRRPSPRRTHRAGCRSTCSCVRKTRLLALAEMRSRPELATMRCCSRGNRLSITPVSAAEWQAVLACWTADRPLDLIGPALVAELLALGLVTGFLAGLLGVGGGMMMVPFMTCILIATRRGHRPGGEDGDRHLDGHHPVHLAVQRARPPPPRRRALGPSCAAWRRASSVGGLLAGAGVFALLKGQGLALFFAVFIGFSALQMLLDRKPSAGARHARAVRARRRRRRHRLLSGLGGRRRRLHWRCPS